MTFVASTAPDVTEGIPTEISTRTDAATRQQRGRTRWDISIGGIGFPLAVSDSNPYVRQSAPVQKQQFDTSPEAGEQTLDGYWIRSQTSWHHGAGASFYEPGVNDAETLPSRYRFGSSVGVDPWSLGDLSLLKKMVTTAAVVSSTPRVASVKLAAGTDAFFAADNGTLKRWDAAGGSTTYTNTGFAGADGVVNVAGSKVIVGGAFGVCSGDISGSSLAILYGTPPSLPAPYWVKNRIVATAANKVYELALDGSSGTTAGDMSTVTPIMTHPDASWTWTGVAEAPGAILAAGYSGGVGAIYAFTLTDSGTSGGSPKLSQGFQVATFPPGEEVHAIQVYLGAYVAIGTSKGVRVGLVADDGKIQYGPLLVKTTQPVKALAARDSFIYAGITGDIDGKSGAARIDLSTTIGGDTLVFPWAYDAQTHDTGTVASMCFVGNTDRVVLAVGAKNFYTQSATVYEDTGYLISGAIRYATTEPKSFRSLDLRARTADGGSVAVSILDPEMSETTLVTLSQGKGGSNISLGALPEGLEYVYYKLLLSSDTATHTITPVTESVGVKALPDVVPQRLIQYPVQIADWMQDAGGAKFGHNGYAAELVQSLEDLLAAKTVVQVEDYTFLTGESYPARVESFELRRTTPPRKGPDGSNFGGIGIVTVRKLT